MNYFLKGLLIGLLLILPLCVLAEHIRSGFVSTWLPLWILILSPLSIGICMPEGERLPFVWRWILFVEYSIVICMLILRTIQTEGLLLAVLLIGSVMGCYLLLNPAR